MNGKIKTGGTQLYTTGVIHTAGRGNAFSPPSLRYTLRVFYKAVVRWSENVFEYWTGELSLAT